MTKETFDFNQKIGSKKLERFALIVHQISQKIGFRVSSRGWGYLMEQAGYIDKSQFDKVESAINRCRKIGLLPVDFVAEESARAFVGVEKPNIYTDKPEVKDTLKWILKNVIHGDRYYTPDWWEGEEYYIQMLVEKIDLKELWTDICNEYHIPIANAKGWSSILQRAEYARRFKEAEEKGLKCVLLYAGDHDPDGLRISDTLRKNLYDVKDIFWSDQKKGYDPSNLEIHRFGLNYDFIVENNYTWIDNLVTGSGNVLARVDEEGNIVPGLKTKGKNAGQEHQNFNMPYLQKYVKKYGVRKCEANAVVTTPRVAQKLVRDEIEKWLGPDSAERFASKRFAVEAEYAELLDETHLREPIERILGEDKSDEE
jgi:hypothetical protein